MMKTRERVASVPGEGFSSTGLGWGWWPGGWHLTSGHTIGALRFMFRYNFKLCVSPVSNVEEEHWTNLACRRIFLFIKLCKLGGYFGSP